MNWIIQLFTEQTYTQAILVLCLICVLGLMCNRLKIKGISLGVTFVFFAGILVGHFGLNINPQMLALSQNFGLVLFVYALGLEVGPSFFPSLRKGGIKLNLLAFAVLLIGTFMAVGLSALFGIPLPVGAGLLSGAVTNTPMLGAAQQTLLQINPEASDLSNTMATACAVGYPFGVVGVMICVMILRVLFRKSSEGKQEHDKPAFVTEFSVSNPAIFGKTLKEIMKGAHVRLVISRVWKSNGGNGRGQVILPDGDTILEECEHVLVLTRENEVSAAEQLFGTRVAGDWNSKDIDWNHLDGILVSRHVFVTRTELNGAKLGDLHLRNAYRINITRVNRAGIDILPSRDLRLQMGDKLTIVGEERAIDKVANVLGNQEKELRNPNLLFIFVGIMLGLVLGSLPISVPGMNVPVRLGIAGGPIIIGILMGAFGPRLHITTYTTHSANLMLRQLGLTFYLAALGLSAGPEFFSTVFRPEGLIWIGISVVLTFVPVLLVGFIAGKVFHTDYSSNVGMLCGAMANPIALNYALSTVDDDAPSVAYATVYPVEMFLRVISGQILMLF